jgi:hypothetical protein
MAFHSGLAKGKVEGATPVSRFVLGDSLAFQHDILDGYSSEFDPCDIIYAEAPWPAGAKVFDKRAGVGERRFSGLTKSLSEVITSLTTPIILITGGWGLTSLPKPDSMLKSRIPTDGVGALEECYIFGYRTEIPEFDRRTGLIPVLATKYDCLGDFFCGYGNVALEAHKQGKRFIVSDYNAECIGYIAQYFSGKSEQ